MKLVFFTQDSEIENLVDNISEIDVVMTDTLDGMEEAIEDERCLFFIDFDFDKKYSESVNQELAEHGNVRRIIISSGMRVKDLKKHSKGKFPAHGYLIKPLTLEIINGVLNDYELSDYILDNQLEEEPADYDDIPLTDIGGKAQVVKEFMIAPDVREEMNKHSSKAGTPDLDSDLNRSIQEKFDDVFNDLASAPSSTAVENLYDDQDDEDVPQAPSDIDEIPTLEVNFGDGGEDMTAGFKAGLSPEDGTGEFEIDPKELSPSNEEEVDMAADNDDIELDDVDLEFDEEQELEEGALEFDGGSDSDSPTMSATASEDDDVSIDLGDEDLDLGDDLEFGSSDSNDEVASSSSAKSDDIDFGEDGDDLVIGDNTSPDADMQMDAEDDDGGLDFGEDTNPTVVAPTGAVDVSDINLDDEDMAEFSAQSENLDVTSTESDVSLEADVDADVDIDEDDLGDGDGDEVAGLEFGEEEIDEDEIGESTAPTMLASTATFNAATATNDLNDEDDDDNLFENEEILEEEAEEVEDGLSFATDEEEETGDIAEEIETMVDTAPSIRAAEKSLPHGQVLESLGQPELLRLQATIKQLRDERTGLLNQVDELKGTVRLVEQDKLTLKAELEEARIEINILKKRHVEENEDVRHRTRVLEERKAFFEEKSRTLQKEFDRLSQKVRIDFNKVKQREKELESQLELVTMDSQSQVKSRDMKILELKRKIDSLEFNMENATIREQKSREDKVRLEERLGKMMKTLRGSIKLLEDDIDLEEDSRSAEKLGKF